MHTVYRITKKTKLLTHADSNYYRSYIVEEEGEHYSVHRPEEIIGRNCLSYKASLEGRLDVVKGILKSSTKLPVPIFPEYGIFLMPTASIRNPSCVWIAYHQVHHYETYKKGTYIHFYDGTGYFVNITESAFDKQYKRTSQVIVHLNREKLFGYAESW